ncbi:uncharacterized protein [Palaemon carinicauda]|uniref:uncharacterized protein n=1 Tax=Palaemon carinicauda TaxID=392227 RepID=UPI0035B6270D
MADDLVCTLQQSSAEGHPQQTEHDNLAAEQLHLAVAQDRAELQPHLIILSTSSGAHVTSGDKREWYKTLLHPEMIYAARISKKKSTHFWVVALILTYALPWLVPTITRSQTMATCFGEGVYYDYLAKIGIAQKECLQFPVSNLHRLDFSLYSQLGYPLHFGGDSLYVPFPSYHTAQQGHYGVPHGYQSLHYRKKRQAEAAGETEAAAVPQQAASPFFDRYYLLDSVNKIMAALSNYTCTLNKLNVIDEYMNININHLTEQYTSLPISDGFKQDLIDGIYYCRDLTYCLPLHNTRSPLPLNLQRLLMAMECEKETRTNACFKEDLRKNVGEFDLSLFPEDDDQESVLNKLSAIITGVDSLNELEIL